jgi:hypothetical protein
MEPDLPADLLPRLRAGLSLSERTEAEVDRDLQLSESPTPSTGLMQVVKGS